MIATIWAYCQTHPLGSIATGIALLSFLWSARTHFSRLKVERRRQFFDIHSQLIKSEEADARKLVWDMDLAADDHWGKTLTPEQRKAAERSLAFFDSISLLARYKVIDPKLFYREWSWYLGANAPQIFDAVRVRSEAEGRTVWPNLLRVTKRSRRRLRRRMVVRKVLPPYCEKPPPPSPPPSAATAEAPETV